MVADRMFMSHIEVVNPLAEGILGEMTSNGIY